MSAETVRRGDEFAFDNIRMRYPNARFFDDDRERLITVIRSGPDHEYDARLEYPMEGGGMPIIDQFKRFYDKSIHAFKTHHYIVDQNSSLGYGMVSLEGLVDSGDIFRRNIIGLKYSRTAISEKVLSELEVVLNPQDRFNLHFFDRHPYSGGVVLIGQRSGAVFGRDGTRFEIPLTDALRYCGLQNYSVSRGADAVRFMRQGKDGFPMKYEARIGTKMRKDPLSALLENNQPLMTSYFHVGLDNDPLPS